MFYLVYVCVCVCVCGWLFRFSANGIHKLTPGSISNNGEREKKKEAEDGELESKSKRLISFPVCVCAAPGRPLLPL
jgi:hypothetical protein